jgi:hypothetical protein
MKRTRFVLVGLSCLGLLLSCTGSGSSPTYKVTYDANGAISGSVPIDANSYEQGAVVTVLGNGGTLVLWPVSSMTYCSCHTTEVLAVQLG